MGSPCCLWLALLFVVWQFFSLFHPTARVWDEESSAFYVLNLTTHNHFPTLRHQTRERAHAHASIKIRRFTFSIELKLLMVNLLKVFCVSFEFWAHAHPQQSNRTNVNFNVHTKCATPRLYQMDLPVCVCYLNCIRIATKCNATAVLYVHEFGRECCCCYCYVFLLLLFRYLQPYAAKRVRVSKSDKLHMQNFSLWQ